MMVKINDGISRVNCSDVMKHVNRKITLWGWVHRVRHLGRITFLQLRDRSGIIQCVLENELAEMKLSLESVISVQGLVVKTMKTDTGVEVIVDKLQLLNTANAPLPIELNQKELDVHMDTLLNNRVLSLRNHKEHLMFNIKSAIVDAFSSFLRNEDFIQIFTPKIVAAGAEGGANLFSIDYFNQPAYLGQSPQFYKQMMVAAGYERVFEVAPVYRAEEHATSRHLNEYISLDLEMGFVFSSKELMELEENLLRFIFNTIRDRYQKELQEVGVTIPLIERIPSISLHEAKQILAHEYHKSTSEMEDLDPEGERLICQYFSEKENSELVFITHYPKTVRPMYAKPLENHSLYTDSFDLLFKGIEITTGGLRIHDYQELISSIEENHLKVADFESYTNVFKYGMPPHGGLAIGLERLTAKIMNRPNVRFASAFPRDRHRLTP